MEELTNTSQTLPEKIRKEHRPENGDIYLHISGSDEGVMRICNRKETEYGVRFDREDWCFTEGKWVPCRWGSISEHDLTESGFYRLCLVPLEEVLAETERAFNGQAVEQKAEDVGTEELVAMGSRLPELLSRTQMLEDRMETMEIVFKARVVEMRQLMEKRLEPLKALAKATRKQLRNIQRVISIIEVYQGEDVEVMTLCEGERAGEGIPVTIRQRILFMDEECAVLDEEGHGMDYWTRDRFYDWLREPGHRNIVLPEEKCVVVAKPRRYPAQYSRNPIEQARLDEWNRHSFILIRNGENVHVVESEQLCIYDTVIPRKADYAKIAEEAKHWQESAERNLEDIKYRSIHFAMVLQGICDRTDIFAPCGDISFMKGVGTQIVFDDERDSLLGTGRPDFRTWLKEQAGTIRRGSRILYVRGLSDGEPMRYELRGNSGNNYMPRIAPPDTGLYTVEEKRGGRLGITYLPVGPWHTERSRRETWIFDRDTVINYDTVGPEDIRGYLEDRSQRRYYQSVIPLLRRYELELEKERGYEDLFLSALRRVLDDKQMSYSEESLRDTLTWWKTKVIHIRPIASDDSKAWRMILDRMTNTQQSTT